jgi:hypothetical protein
VVPCEMDARRSPIVADRGVEEHMCGGQYRWYATNAGAGTVGSAVAMVP